MSRRSLPCRPAAACNAVLWALVRRSNDAPEPTTPRYMLSGYRRGMTEPTALLGTWSLSRVVEDRLAGERHDVRGTATLELETPDRLRWGEEGTMRWRGRTVPVSRTL